MRVERAAKSQSPVVGVGGFRRGRAREGRDAAHQEGVRVRDGGREDVPSGEEVEGVPRGGVRGDGDHRGPLVAILPEIFAQRPPTEERAGSLEAVEHLSAEARVARVASARGVGPAEGRARVGGVVDVSSMRLGSWLEPSAHPVRGLERGLGALASGAAFVRRVSSTRRRHATLIVRVGAGETARRARSSTSGVRRTAAGGARRAPES